MGGDVRDRRGEICRALFSTVLLVLISGTVAADPSGLEETFPLGRLESNDTVRLGEPAPIWDAMDELGKPVTLGTFAGRTVLLSFGSVFCRDCRNTASCLEEVRERYSASGLVVVMVCVDGQRAGKALSAFRQNTGAGFLTAFDCDQRTMDRYGVDMIPYQFLIDRWGMIRGINAGFDRNMFAPEELESLLDGHEETGGQDLRKEGGLE